MVKSDDDDDDNDDDEKFVITRDTPAKAWARLKIVGNKANLYIFSRFWSFVAEFLSGDCIFVNF